MPPYVNALAQTPDGYLWIGAASGLYRFDGLRVEPFGQRLPGGAVLSLAATPSGDLWIGSASGVSRLSHGRLTSFDVQGLFVSPGVRFIALGQGGDVWAATDKVARFDGRSWRVMESDWGASELFRQPGGVWGLAVARDGVVWTKNLLGLYFLRPGATRFEKAQGYAGSVVDFARAPDGRLWTADVARDRFYALPDVGVSGSPPPPPAVGAAVPPGTLGRILFDRDGAMWNANSVTGGLARLRGVAGSTARIEHFTAGDGLSARTPTKVFEDSEGDLWVGTENGVDRFSPANVVTEASISVRAIGAEITATDEAVYIADGSPPPKPATGHSAQRLYAVASGAPQRLPLPLAIDELTVLNAQGADSVLIGTRRKLLRLRNGVAAAIPFPAEAAGGELSSATQAGDDIWAVFSDRGLFHRHGELWTRVAGPGLQTSVTTRMRVDRQGVVWLFDGDRTRRLIGGRLVALEDPDGPNTAGVAAFIPSPDGVLMGGLLGLSWFDERRFHTLSRRQAPFLGVSGIVADDRGATWIHTTSGIYRVAGAQLREAFRDPAVRLDYRLFDARDGLRGPATAFQFGGSAARGPDGRLWFLNTDNVAWIDPHHLYQNTQAPPVSIRSVTVAGRAFDAAGAGRLPAGSANLRIVYAGLSLQNPERVTFRYQLEGVDPGWIDAGGRREAFYTRLAPGRYRFRVIAGNADGVWNPTGATLAFEIPPTLVQTLWFKALLVLVLLALLAAGVVWRMRLEMARLQALFDTRIGERERIARELHDTLLQGVQGLMLQFQSIANRLPQGEDRMALDAALDRAEAVLVESRARVRQLRAASVESDLAEGLLDIAETVIEGERPRFHLVVEGRPRALHALVAEEARRIAEEAMRNAVRHAHASDLEVLISFEPSGLRVTIRDDGVGIDAKALAGGGPPDHFGLLGMRERAGRIGAQLSLSSGKQRGAELTLFVPARSAYGRRRARLAASLWDRWRRRLEP